MDPNVQLSYSAPLCCDQEAMFNGTNGVLNGVYGTQSCVSQDCEGCLDADDNCTGAYAGDACWSDAAPGCCWDDSGNQGGDPYCDLWDQYGTDETGAHCSPPNDLDVDDCGSDDGIWGYCDSNGCCVPGDNYYDPILIDVNGDGYSLTSVPNGVMFDMVGNGKQVQTAWTSAGSDDAFLALDRNGDGRIDNGTELFSNFTPQPNTKSGKNGWNALAFYDLPENGGNGDGWIDAQDAVYSKLLLWVDKNHNGVSEPNELFTLPQLGVKRIFLHYTQSKWVDAYGNMFRYRARMVRGDPYPGEDDWAYDVLLQHGK
jgi:hypothetical protein